MGEGFPQRERRDHAGAQVRGQQVAGEQAVQKLGGGTGRAEQQAGIDPARMVPGGIAPGAAGQILWCAGQPNRNEAAQHGFELRAGGGFN